MVTIVKHKGVYKGFSEGGETSYRGLSTDSKPNNVPENSVFVELDTGVGYYYSNGEWQVFGANKPDDMGLSVALVG